MASSSLGDPPRPSGSWGVLLVLVLLIVAANAYYIIPASIFPTLTNQLGIGATQAGFLISVMYGAQMILGVPVGILVDKVNNRWVIIVASMVLVVTYALSWFAAIGEDFHLLLVTRGIAAPLTAAIWTTGINLVGRLFEPETRATAIGVLTGGPPAGFALALFSGPLIADWMNWHAVFVVFAAPLLLGGVLFWHQSRNLPKTSIESRAPSVGDFRGLLTKRATWIVAVLAFLGFSLYAFITSWLPSYMTEALGVSLAISGLLVALFPAVGMVARGASGSVSDRVFNHRRRPVGVISFLVSLPAIVVIALTKSVLIVVFALLILGVFVQLGAGLFYAIARESAESNVAATGVAFTTSMATLGGFSAPIIGGYLIDVQGYSAAFGYAVIVCFLGLLVSVVTPESVRNGTRT